LPRVQHRARDRLEVLHDLRARRRHDCLS
jgi:hypothetical protein